MNPDQTVNFNNNASQCIHSAGYFGKSIIYNICSGVNTEIPWGGTDWALSIFFCAMGLGLVLLLLAFVYWVVFGDKVI